MPSPAIKQKSSLHRASSLLLIFAIALGSVSIMLLILGMSPFDIALAMIRGSLSSWLRFSHVLSVWVPLLLCCSGLLFTFRSGLWNIGVEGQMISGAIAATILLRLDPAGLAPGLIISGAFALGFLGGALWGALAGLLKNHGGVNEIFGGLGLNFVAQGMILWLIMGPWKRAGIASMSGTDLFARELWLFAPAGWRVAPAALVLAFLAFALTALLLGGTRFGLQIKASGKNPAAARLFGINPGLTNLLTMLIGGGLAGLAGAVQVSCVYHRLLPSISSGYGYLALLVVMLARYTITPVPFICLFFACLAAGSIQLPIALQIDSSLSGVIQGACVVSALLVYGIRQRRRRGQ
jgi:ABC-type uncharacterized transport system permease subunit